MIPEASYDAGNMSVTLLEVVLRSKGHHKEGSNLKLLKNRA